MRKILLLVVCSLAIFLVGCQTFDRWLAPSKPVVKIVKITSNPSGATIYIDKKYNGTMKCGVTPLTFYLKFVGELRGGEFTKPGVWLKDQGDQKNFGWLKRTHPQGYEFEVTVKKIRYKEGKIRIDLEPRDKTDYHIDLEEIETISVDEVGKHIGETKIVRCRIVYTDNVRGRVFLFTGKDYRKDFAVEIYYLSNFSFNPAAYYLGKEIEVLGLIQGGWREGLPPFISVTSPDEIRVIE